MRIFYHGSPTPNIKVLKPRLDPRLGIEGIFVSDLIFSPMIFSLLPVRAHATVNLTTRGGKFIKGKVVTPKINEVGWLYILEIEDDKIIEERERDKFYLTAPVKIKSSKKILKEDVLKLGWVVKIKKTK